ncbi:MAG: DUF1844 domain-containing protein [Candidatus Hydrogenedentes bacterium]|nr:DUF1844 domain-containing protein [Candidatus Hydrogenedentota bacterium]
MTDEKKKILIDEDWKAQVAREKEEARAKTEQKGTEAPQAAAEDKPEAETPKEGPVEANFTTLVSSLATQGLLALGIIAPQDTKEVYVDIATARFVIDTLMMLREKTKGNLTPEESANLTSTVADLQRFYVARAQQVQKQSLEGAGVDLNNLRNPKQ